MLSERRKKDAYGLINWREFRLNFSNYNNRSQKMLSDTFRYYEERCAKEGGMEEPPGAYHWGKWATRVAKLERCAAAAQELLLAQGSAEVGYGPILQEAEARMIEALKELKEE